MNDYIIEERDAVVIRFAGDSGDGMQLTGTQFTNTSAVFGNDISTMPDFPAEIRAPAGHAGRRQRLPGQLFQPATS
jgi:2-oxoglutarate ferredoxin oxidoreductase subunit alpha